jgi:hypothetical protein
MKKILTLFQRDPATFHVRDAITPGCEWVSEGFGQATRKFDGSACLIRNGQLFARFDARNGHKQPAGWEACEPAPDPISGSWPGWVPMREGDKAYQWHVQAQVMAQILATQLGMTFSELHPDGTYELCGPMINGNPENFDTHVLIKHGLYDAPDCPRTFAAIRAYLANRVIEGIVWHHSDGRMAKIKKQDFSYPA